MHESGFFRGPKGLTLDGAVKVLMTVDNGATGLQEQMAASSEATTSLPSPGVEETEEVVPFARMEEMTS